MTKSIRNITTLITVLFIALCQSCSKDMKPDQGLMNLSDLASSDPHAAITKLGEIDSQNLSSYNKKYYELIKIKANDKAGIFQTSDSLILPLIDYFKRHGDKATYAEALYYGGRAYYDIGDLPTSLKYYQEAEQTLPNEKQCSRLRSNILFQIADILNRFRLCKETIPYLKKTLEIDKSNKDTINTIITLSRIGADFMHTENLDSATYYYHKARDLAQIIGHLELMATQDMYLSDIYSKKHNPDSALMLIRKAIKIKKTNIVYNYAMQIYRMEGKYDTAAIYANHLIHSKDTFDVIQGFRNILLPQLRPYLPKDSLLPYVHRFYRLVENRLNQNEGTMAMMQNSLYNYQIQEKRRIESEKAKDNLLAYLLICGIVILILALSVTLMLLRNKKQKLSLIEARSIITNLREKIESIPDNGESPDDSGSADAALSHEARHDNPVNMSLADLKETIMREYADLQKRAVGTPSVSREILESEGYNAAIQSLQQNLPIPEKSDIWKDLEDTVEKSSPGFRYKLQTLLGGNLKLFEYHIALLIKCGFSPTELSILLGRAKSTIAERRSKLCFRLTSDKSDPQMTDRIISLL